MHSAAEYTDHELKNLHLS